MVVTLQNPYLTSQEYLDWEPLQDIRYEYVDGEVHAMTGGSLPHSEIAVNLTTLLKNHLRGKGCRILGSDGKAGIAENGPFLYADVSYLVRADEIGMSNCEIGSLRHAVRLA